MIETAVPIIAGLNLANAGLHGLGYGTLGGEDPRRTYATGKAASFATRASAIGAGLSWGAAAVADAHTPGSGAPFRDLAVVLGANSALNLPFGLQQFPQDIEDFVDDVRHFCRRSRR